MMLENKTSSNLDRVALTVWPTDLIPVPMPHIQVRELALSHGQTPAIPDAAFGLNPQGLPKPAPPSLADGQTPIIQDPELGFYLYHLSKPLPPQDRILLEFALEYDNYGFQNSNPNTDLAHNGTYIGERYSPFIGYAPDIELTDDSTRHKHGLQNTKRMPTLDDAAARNENWPTPTPTGSISKAPSAPAPTRSRSCLGISRKSGHKTAAATSITKWMPRSWTSTLSIRDATRFAATNGKMSTWKSTTTRDMSSISIA
jgi:hypothetical protein